MMPYDRLISFDPNKVLTNYIEMSYREQVYKSTDYIDYSQ